MIAEEPFKHRFGEFGEQSSSTTVTNDLKNQKAELVTRLLNPDDPTNLADLQDGVIRQLNSESGLSIGAVSRQAINQIYAEEGVELSEDQLKTLAAQLVKGNSQDSQTNLSLVQVREELLAQITQYENVAKDAEAALETLDPELRDLTKEELSEVAKSLTSDTNLNQLQGDSYFYLLAAKSVNPGTGELTDEILGQALYSLVSRVYEGMNADVILQNSQFDKQVILDIEFFKQANTPLKVKEYLDDIKTELGLKLEIAATELTPIMTEMTEIFPELINMSDFEKNGFASLSSVHFPGAAIRMLMLENLAKSSSQDINQLVATYFRAHFAKQGLTTELSQSPVEALVLESEQKWNDPNQERSFYIELDGSKVVDGFIGETFNGLLSRVEKFIDITNISPEQATALREVTINYLNGLTAENPTVFDIELLNLLAPAGQQLEVTTAYFKDYFTNNGLAYELEPDLLQTIAGKYLSGVDSQRYITPEFTDLLRSYSGLETLFPGGKHLVLANYNGQD
jgi:hypothetical protein